MKNRCQETVFTAVIVCIAVCLAVDVPLALAFTPSKSVSRLGVVSSSPLSSNRPSLSALLSDDIIDDRSSYDLENYDSTSESRRKLVTSMATAVAGSILMGTDATRANAASTDELTKYQDEACKFSISLPSDWTQSIQELPDRRKIVLYIKPDSDQKTLIFMAFTPVRDDYTSLGSFGSADEVAEATILPKSTLANVKGVESKMLSVDSKKQSYMFDYITEVPPQPTTHFRTIFTLKQGATGGAGNVLVTITAQAPESDYSAVKSLFDKVIDSYEA